MRSKNKSKKKSENQIFDTFDRGFSTADKLFAMGQLLKVVHGDKEFSNVHSNKDFPRLKIIARWGYLPISMVLWSERILKSKMLQSGADIKIRERYLCVEHQKARG